MIAPSRATLVRDALDTLKPLRVKKLFGSEAFFLGERMFAVLGAEALVLRLPEPLRTNALLAGHARPYLSNAALLTGWVEVPYGTELAQLARLAQAAHAAAARGPKPVRKRFRRAARRTVSSKQ